MSASRVNADQEAAFTKCDRRFWPKICRACSCYCTAVQSRDRRVAHCFETRQCFGAFCTLIMPCCMLRAEHMQWLCRVPGGGEDELGVGEVGARVPTTQLNKHRISMIAHVMNDRIDGQGRLSSPLWVLRWRDGPFHLRPAPVMSLSGLVSDIRHDGTLVSRRKVGTYTAHVGMCSKPQ